jgi:hypothetical protein
MYAGISVILVFSLQLADIFFATVFIFAQVHLAREEKCTITDAALLLKTTTPFFSILELKRKQRLRGDIQLNTIAAAGIL